MTALAVGFLGARHPHALARLDLLRDDPRVRLVGFCERDAGIAAQFARTTGLATFADPDAILREGLDVAIVEGLDPEVPGLARRAAAAGVRTLLLEKPGAASPQEFLALATELDAAGVAVEIGYELHYCDTVRMCRELIGALGQVTLARFHAGCPIGAGAELWQSVPEDVGGLAFTEGSHMLEIVAELIGVPERVDAAVRRLPERPPVRAVVFKPDLFSPSDPDRMVAVGTLVHEDVGAAILHYSELLATIDFTAWEPTTWCEEWSIEVYGTNGALHATIEPMDVRITLRTPAAGLQAGTTVLRPPRPAAGARPLLQSYRRQLDSVLTRARGECPDDACDLRRATDVMRMLAAIYAASAAGTTTAVATARDEVAS